MIVNLINMMKFMQDSSAFLDSENYLKLETEPEGEKQLCFIKLQWTFGAK